MSTPKELIADAFELSAQQANQAPGIVCKQAFFDQLAQHGIVVDSDERAEQLLEASNRLEAKRAAHRAASDPVRRALSTILGKTAMSPQASQPADRPSIIDDVASTPHLHNEVRAKTAEFLSDPVLYANLMTAFTE